MSRGVLQRPCMQSSAINLSMKGDVDARAVSHNLSNLSRYIKRDWDIEKAINVHIKNTYKDENIPSSLFLHQQQQSQYPSNPNQPTNQPTNHSAKIKFTTAAPTLFSGVLAAAAPSAANEFVLKASSSSSAVNNGVIIFHGTNLLVSQFQGQHSVKSQTSNDGTLAIENGDGDGHLSLGYGTSTLSGFSFSGSGLKSAAGPFHTCEEEMIPWFSDAHLVQTIYVKVTGVSLADNVVEVTLNKPFA
ncbi:hypothetical protein BDW69DRAFT_188973 [Aspergillus filifer]